MGEGRPTWFEDAECRGYPTELFFIQKGQEETEQAVAQAKVICRRCRVNPQCLEYALANNERFGIWGGKTVLERKAERRRRAKENLT